MRRNGKEENTGKTQEPLETARKPRRGRKPRAAKQQEEAGAATAAETETVSEKTEETATESETVSEKVEETATESETVSEKAEETVTETETASEKAEETATESETISENVEETVTESETISENVEETVTESETASEKAEETATESETVSEKVAETVMESETVSEQKNTPGEAEMSAAETESVVQEPDSGEQAVPPSETAQEADTGHENETAEEPAAEGENACEEDAAEEENTKETGEELENTDGEMPEEEPERLPATAIPAQITVSPLKRMKQEFSERAQIIREQMRNIQNAFITIGFQLHWIRENNMFRVMDYKNVYDYAEKEYGLKKTTCCNFISIIENYAERDESGEVIESIADCYRNYSASQLVAMLGMNEDMRQQVSPDMSVRAINRLKKGEPEPGTVAASPAPVEEPAPVQETEKKPDVEKEAENPAAEEEAVSDDTVHEEGQETGEMQEAESPGTAEVGAARLEEPEDTETMETENHGDDAEGHTLEAANSEGDTLVEIDSYTDYQSMADELDLLMRTVFAEDASVRVKIVCVQG